jgi:hypothetical protein
MDDKKQGFAPATGIPAATAVPLLAPTDDEHGVLALLALVLHPEVHRAELDAFVARFRFVPRGQVALAADSQARWTLEPDGRVTVTFLAEDGTAALELPADPRMHAWAGMIRASGGTLSVMLLPGLPSSDADQVARRIGSTGGEYWHLSVGYLPA